MKKVMITSPNLVPVTFDLLWLKCDIGQEYYQGIALAVGGKGFP